MITEIDATVWLGPVNLSMVTGATVPGKPAASVNCCGAPDPKCPPLTCPDLAQMYLDPSGRRLPKLLQRNGLPEDSMIAAGAFSAGGSILKRLCLKAEDRDQIRVCHSADADYEATQGPNGPIYTEGYVLYALEALSSPVKMFVATASANPNKTFGSGIQVITSTRKEIEWRSGKAFELVPGGIPGVTQKPAQLWRLGNVWIAEYPDIPHGQHATLLAPQVWKGLILPWLSGIGGEPIPGPPEPIPGPPGPGPGPGPVTSGSSFKNVAAFLTGTAVGYAGARWLAQNRHKL